MGDYSIFTQSWTEPNGGLHGYLSRFLASGDSTFQHIAIWTLLQLLESDDQKLLALIGKSEDIIRMIKTISNQNIEYEGDAVEEGDHEVIVLARRALQLLAKPTLVEG